MPCFLAELCNLLLHKKIIASSEQFEQKTLWLDIFFNDQNSTDIVKDLEAAELIYQQAALHALFLMYEPLSRGWVLFEIGVRVWKCAKDYSLTLEEILGILSGKDSKERIVGYKPITPSEIASKFPIIVAAAAKTDIQKDLIRLVQNLLFVTAAFPVAVILAVADSNMTPPILWLDGNFDRIRQAQDSGTLLKLLFSSGICTSTSGTSNFSDPGVWKEGEKAFDKIIKALSNRADRERTSGKYDFYV